LGTTRRQDSDTGDGQRGSLGLEELREEIEEIDTEILEAVARRTYVAESIAHVKEERGMEIYDPEREEAVLQRVEERARELELDEDSVRELFETLMSLSKRHQRDRADENADGSR